jgi:hypothetical protein
MKSVLKWCGVLGLATTLVAQTAPTKAKSRKTAASAAITAADVQALRDALAAQQQGGFPRRSRRKMPGEEPFCFPPGDVEVLAGRLL